MTGDEYEKAVDTILQSYGMAIATPACPAENGNYYRSPRVPSVLVRNPDTLDEAQRPIFVEELKNQLKLTD